MPAFIDLTGQRFGRLTAEAYTGLPRQKRWRCRCVCGNETFASASELKTGRRISCGCVFRANDPDHPRKTHGMKGTKIYDVWKAMRKRCRNPNDNSYHRYGARGIRVCERWDKSFSAFYEDMGPRPSDDHSIERRDNDGPYSPDNCYWGTEVQQQNNRRTNRNITHNGITQSLEAWSRQSKVSGQHLRGRLRDGWYFADAISLPVGARRPRKRPRNDPEP